MKQLCRLSVIAAVCGLSHASYAADQLLQQQLAQDNQAATPSLNQSTAAQKPKKNAPAGDPKSPVKCPTSQPDPQLAEQNVTISAKNVTMANNDQADFSGDVVVCLPKGHLTSNTAKFSRHNKSMEANGEIHYTNDVVNVTSDRFDADLIDKQVTLFQSEYVLTEQMGHGSAQQLNIKDQNKMVLTEATFSTCPIDDNGWALTAETITLSSEEGWGSAENAAVRINDIPVIYIPYFSFPLDDRRRSGFLYPRIASSVKLGVEVRTPYYWNIAPNYDATITPRLMTKRGLQLQTETRYLFDNHQGLVNVELLPEDSERKDLDERYLLHWQHKLAYSDNLRGFVDLTQISEDAYLNDLGSPQHDSSDTVLNQQIALAYFGDAVDSDISIQDFRVLGQHPSSYRALPQISFANHSPYTWGYVDFDWYGQYSHFDNEDALITRVDRFHLAPSISSRYTSAALSVSSELSLLHTNYRQTYQLASAVNPAADPLSIQENESRTITRTLPKFRLHSIVNFERDAEIFGTGSIMSFEPQVQYLYIPSRDQSEIGLFDSTRLQDDYFGLFRDNRFSGLDRIADANQITIGATSRWFDPNSIELFHVSVGQIFHFDQDRQPLTPDDSQFSGSRSELAADVFMRWSQRWDLSANVQYDENTNKLTKSVVKLNYRADELKLAQLNHRYTRSVSGSKIEQLGLITSFPIADNWQFVGGYHRDLTHHRSIDSYWGVQYDACCWSVQLVSSRSINTNFDAIIPGSTDLPSNFDNSISLSLSIKGLNGTQGFNAATILEEGVFGKRRKYFLNN